MAIHGRNDHDEERLLPMRSFRDTAVHSLEKLKTGALFFPMVAERQWSSPAGDASIPPYNGFAMQLLSPFDMIAIVWFVCAWAVYANILERTVHGRSGLNARMDKFRTVWIRRMLDRDTRMTDMQIMAALQNGTAFFASTTLLSIGGALTLLRSPDEILTVVSLLPFSAPTSRGLWEFKTIGLVLVFIYAFFKFAWSYRLFNYVSILFGAMPPLDTER